MGWISLALSLSLSPLWVRPFHFGSESFPAVVNDDPTTLELSLSSGTIRTDYQNQIAVVHRETLHLSKIS